MFNLTSLFISPAWADTAIATDPITASGNSFMQFVPFFLILGVFYFFLIRPQQKKLQEQENMLAALKKGDRVVTSGGIIGTIQKIEGDEHLIVEIADSVRVKLLRSAINSIDRDDADKSPAKNDNAKAE